MPPPPVDFQKEVRFAVVLYGGVSLAIYINGVTQELLRMVRATAPDPDDPTQLYHAEARGSEAVYRKLGQILSGCGTRLEHEPTAADAVRTRFVVDIVSGTSAGGINGVFLAKALAQDQSLDRLKQLWVEEGDIGLLLNDDDSAVENLDVQNPPRSLLNSQRMYWKLYEAMADMDAAGSAPLSPYADEIDLFVTATDLSGRLLQLPLSDGNIFERRHRAVMHFHYASAEVAPDPQNRFTAAYTPLLAFAARATSSFPVAFEPMLLTDAIDVLRQTGVVRNDAQAQEAARRWADVTTGYDTTTPLPSVDFPNRAFADGGYLDNKPFSHAIDQIPKRHAALPVDRKLIYVEPAPEQPERLAERSRRPDAIENAWAAVSTLPRYETIRQDLEQVLARNEEVRRVRRLVEHIEESAEASADPTGGAPTALSGFEHVKLRPGQWVEMDTLELFRTFGRGYLTYHRLKVSSVTDDLTALLACHFDIETGTAQEHALRSMVQVWRDREYGPQHPAAQAANKTDQLNRFLLDFDISYRVRRLRYLRRMIDEALCADAGTQFAREIAAQVPEPLRLEFLAEACEIGKRLRAPYKTLRTLGIRAEDLSALGQSPELQAALSLDPGAPAAHAALHQQAPLVAEAVARVRQRFGEAFRKASGEVLDSLDPDGAPNEGARVARERLRRVYNRFEDDDSMTFPVLYRTGVGELSEVHVTRISPLDATRILDESTTRERKLRGTALGNFGAFLDPGWRENDILWGRLDGAERIVTALLPATADRGLRETLIDEAHELILREELDRLMPGPEALRERFHLYRRMQRAEPERDLAARSLARSTTVIGRILEQISKDRRWEGLPFATLTRAGRILWGAVEVATPRSLWDLLFQHWLKLAYLFEIALIAAGFVVPAAQPLGVKLLLWTLGVHLGVLLVRDYLVESRRVILAIAVVAGLCVFVVTLVGALEIWNFFESGRRLYEMSAHWWAARLTAIAAVLTAVVAGWMAAQGRRLQYAVGQRPRAPLIALEFAETPAEFDRVAGDWWHPNRRVLRAMQEADSWFIAGYVGLFAGLGWLAILSGDKWGGWITIAAAAAAGWFDCLENKSINAALGRKLAALGPLQTAVPALWKWVFCFVALDSAGSSLYSLHSGWIAGIGWAAQAAAVGGILWLVWKRVRR